MTPTSMLLVGIETAPLQIYLIRGNPCDPWRRLLDFFFGEFQFQAERVGEAVGEVGQAGEQVEIDDFGFGEFFFQDGDVGVGDVVRGTGEFFSIDERGFFFGGVTRVVPGAERRPVFGGEAHALGRGHVMLGAIMAASITWPRPSAWASPPKTGLRSAPGTTRVTPPKKKPRSSMLKNSPVPRTTSPTPTSPS